MSDYLEQTVKNFAVLTVKHPECVTKLRGNVLVDVRLDGLNSNVTQVCIDRLEMLVLLVIVLLVLDLKAS